MSDSTTTSPNSIDEHEDETEEDFDDQDAEIAVPDAVPKRPEVENCLKAMDRLRREGRFEAFCLERIKAKNSGLARKAAFRLALSKFPPLDMDALIGLEKFINSMGVNGGGVNFDRDFEWAYAHIGIRHVKIQDAPTPSAWELLIYAKENREIFFKSFLTWSEKRRKDQLGQDAFMDDRRQKFTLLDRLDEALRRDLTSRITSWMQSTPEAVVEALATLGWSCEKITPQPHAVSENLS